MSPSKMGGEDGAPVTCIETSSWHRHYARSASVVYQLPTMVVNIATGIASAETTNLFNSAETGPVAVRIVERSKPDGGGLRPVGRQPGLSNRSLSRHRGTAVNEHQPFSQVHRAYRRAEAMGGDGAGRGTSVADQRNHGQSRRRGRASAAESVARVWQFTSAITGAVLSSALPGVSSVAQVIGDLPRATSVAGGL